MYVTQVNRCIVSIRVYVFLHLGTDFIFQKKRRTHRKFQRSQHRATRMDYTTTSSSSTSCCFQYGNNFATPSSDNLTPCEYSVSAQYHSVSTFEPVFFVRILKMKLRSQYEQRTSTMDSANSSDSTLEDSLQRKCTELQRIIADRTEELRVVSEQLCIARNANQQTNDPQYDQMDNPAIYNEVVIAPPPSLDTPCSYLMFQENRENGSSGMRHFASISDLCMTENLAEQTVFFVVLVLLEDNITAERVYEQVAFSGECAGSVAAFRACRVFWIYLLQRICPCVYDQ